MSAVIPCSVCGRPMNPGQRRGDAPDGSRAHASCVALTDTNLRLGDLDHIGRILDAAAEGETRRDLLAAVALITDREVQAGIEDATKEAIPSKATRLKALMDHAADGLDRQVAVEVKAASYRQAGPGLTAAMQEASTILRTVAIYVMDDES